MSDLLHLLLSVPLWVDKLSIVTDSYNGSNNAITNDLDWHWDHLTYSS